MRTQNEYRMTRKKYWDTAIEDRQGYYIVAESPLAAVLAMSNKFPNESFTCELWKEASPAPCNYPEELHTPACKASSQHDVMFPPVIEFYGKTIPDPLRTNMNVCKCCSKLISGNLSSFCSPECLRAFSARIFNDMDGRN